MCVAPEVSSISSGAGGHSSGISPEVVASSVMADHGKTLHSSGAFPRLRGLRLAATLPAATWLVRGLVQSPASPATALLPWQLRAAGVLLAIAAVGVT